MLDIFMHFLEHENLEVLQNPASLVLEFCL
jgi:hypothetical protein